MSRAFVSSSVVRLPVQRLAGGGLVWYQCLESSFIFEANIRSEEAPFIRVFRVSLSLN